MDCVPGRERLDEGILDSSPEIGLRACRSSLSAVRELWGSKGKMFFELLSCDCGRGKRNLEGKSLAHFRGNGEVEP